MKEWEKKIIGRISNQRRIQRLYMWNDRSAQIRGKRYEEKNNIPCKPREILKLLVYKLWKDYDYCIKCNYEWNTLLDSMPKKIVNYRNNRRTIKKQIRELDLEIHGGD